MRRLFAVATLCATLLLLAAVAAGAALGAVPHKSGGASDAELAAARAHLQSAPGWQGIRPRFVPAPMALGLTADINGTIRDYYGNALTYADVDGYVGAAHTDGGTDGSGYYSFSGIPVASGNGEITMLSNDSQTWYDWWNLSWPSPGPTTLDMQPGGIDVSGTTGGPWGAYATTLATDAYSTSGAEYKEANEIFPGSLSAKAPVLPGTFQGMGVYFFNDEGAEVTSPLSGQTVTSGATLAQSAVVDEAAAQRVWTGGSSVNLSKPWGSGKPGSRLKIWLHAFPTNWTNHISGYSENPSNSASKNFGNFRSLRTSAHSRTLTVPKKAVPGYGYRLWIDHTVGPLSLTTWFQVCTLKSTKTTVSKGATIRLSGVVPVQDHHGSTAGKRTTVYCFVHRGTASQPTKINPTSQHWQYLGSAKTDGFGKFHTPLIRPLVTLTLVMYYPGDDWYNAAYTSPVKITVR